MDKQKVLEAHNILREEVGLKPLVWSDDLAKIAEKWAKKVAKKNGQYAWVLEHSTTPDLGENIAGGWLDRDNPELLVRQGWGEMEKEYFNPETRQCYPNQVCGHYTQMVWRNTTKVGCGTGINENGKYILVCNYDPPGNYRGQPAF